MSNLLALATSRGRSPSRPDGHLDDAFAPVPEWGGQEVQFRAEEDAFYDGKQVSFLDGRQTALTLIR